MGKRPAEGGLSRGPILAHRGPTRPLSLVLPAALSPHPAAPPGPRSHVTPPRLAPPRRPSAVSYWSLHRAPPPAWAEPEAPRPPQNWASASRRCAAAGPGWRAGGRSRAGSAAAGLSGRAAGRAMVSRAEPSRAGRAGRWGGRGFAEGEGAAPDGVRARGGRCALGQGLCGGGGAARAGARLRGRVCSGGPRPRAGALCPLRCCEIGTKEAAGGGSPLPRQRESPAAARSSSPSAGTLGFLKNPGRDGGVGGSRQPPAWSGGLWGMRSQVTSGAHFLGGETEVELQRLVPGSVGSDCTAWA